MCHLQPSIHILVCGLCKVSLLFGEPFVCLVVRQKSMTLGSSLDFVHFYSHSYLSGLHHTKCWTLNVFFQLIVERTTLVPSQLATVPPPCLFCLTMFPGRVFSFLRYPLHPFILLSCFYEIYLAQFIFRSHFSHGCFMFHSGRWPWCLILYLAGK